MPPRNLFKNPGGARRDPLWSCLGWEVGVGRNPKGQCPETGAFRGGGLGMDPAGAEGNGWGVKGVNCPARQTAGNWGLEGQPEAGAWPEMRGEET